MALSKTCQTCPLVKKNNDKICYLKENFKSKKTANQFEAVVLEIDIASEKQKLSFNNLKKQFEEDYPKWSESLISIPTAFLLKYANKVPFYVTEDDVKEYLNGKFQSVLKDKRSALCSQDIKQVVDEVCKNIQNENLSVEKASELLNEHILALIFIGDRNQTVCKKCENKVKCNNKKCNAKKGLKTKFDVAKDHYKKNLWPSAIKTSLTAEEIIKFAEKKLEENITRFLSSSPEFSLLSSMRGQKTENNIVPVLQSHLSHPHRPGLLISSYRVFSSLKNLLKSYNIKLSKCRNDDTQVEHDIISIIPVNDTVRVNFTQAKATLQLPWPHSADKKENIVSACQKAFQQVANDLEAFGELAEHFLAREEFDKLELNFTVSITSLDGITEEEICKNCSSCIYEEKKVYMKEEEQILFGVSDLISPTNESLNIFKTLATLYVGGGSIIELKNSQEGYFKEVKRLKQVEDGMLKVFTNKSEEVFNKLLTENKTIKLGPDQNNIYSSGIGLHQSYAVISPWGGGKSMLLELELRRVVELYNETKEPVKIYVVVYEIKATDLMKHYETLVCDFNRKGNVQIEVLNLRQICCQYTVSYKNRDTTSIINSLCEILSNERNGPIHLFMDEVFIENPNCSSPIDLLGKSPFILDGDIFPWSDLDCYDVNLVVCINPESQDLPQLLDVDFDTLSTLKERRPEQGPVPTIPMWRVFRCSKAIHLFIQELQDECSNEHQEFGYKIPPHMSKEGHEISGNLPIWIEVPEHQHMKCSKSKCNNCFLVCIEEKFQVIHNELQMDGIPNEDILVIVNSSALTKNCNGTFEMEYLRKKYPYLKFRSNFEFDGCEAKVVIVIRNGGLLSFSLSNAISRAVSRLIIFSPDDRKILEKCCQKDLLVRQNMMLDLKFNSQEIKVSSRLSEFLSGQPCSSKPTQTNQLNNHETEIESKTTQTSPWRNFENEVEDTYNSFLFELSIPHSNRTPSSARVSLSMTDESRSSSLLSLDSGVSGMKSNKPKFQQLHQLHPDILNTLVQVQATYDLSENDAQGILVDIGNLIFGQNWEKDDEFRPRTSTWPSEMKKTNY